MSESDKTKAYRRAYYEAHKEELKSRAREYKKAHREHYNQLQREWAKSNPTAARVIEKRTKTKNAVKIKSRKEQWYRENSERIKTDKRSKYASDPDFRARVLSSQKTDSARERIRESKRTPEHRLKFNIHRNKRISEDLNFKIRSRLGSRLSNAIRLGRAVKTKSTMELIGCSIEFLKTHIESLFSDGMTWEKFNTGEIHIDHKRPCVSFDLTDETQQKVCFHWSNLQPLWAFDNLSKHGKIIC